MKEGFKRGVRPDVALPKMESGQVSGIEVQRLDMSNQGVPVEVVSVRVDLSNNNWQETELGLLRVDPLFLREGKDGMVPVLRVHFERLSELRQHGSDSLNGNPFRDVALDFSGQGWQELRRNLVGGHKSRKLKNAKPKWLHVAVPGFGQQV